MALSVRVPWTPDANIAGALSRAYVTYALLMPDSSYPAGGYPVTPGTFNLTTKVLCFVPSANTPGSTGYMPVYDPVNATCRIFSIITGQWTEIGTGTDLSTVQVNTAIWGW